MKWLEDDSKGSRRELAVLKLLGLFDRPATTGCVEALLKPPSIDGLTEHNSRESKLSGRRSVGTRRS